MSDERLTESLTTNEEFSDLTSALASVNLWFHF